MFNNWVSVSELYYVLRKWKREPERISRLLARLPLRNVSKVKATWAHTQSPPSAWEAVPAIQQRWNRLVSGDPDVDHYTYLSRKYLGDRGDVRALSLGCGGGEREMRWAETKKFRRIDAYDLSESRVRAAAEAAKQKGLSGVLNFAAANVYDLELEDRGYDVVLGEGSLHHFSPLEPLLRKVDRVLQPGGCLFVDEFVGPTRFQWTDRQLEAVNALLAVLPTPYKTLWHSDATKLELIRPSRLSMVLRDPSEAVESSNILPLLHQIFEVVEVKGYGGTILHLLLGGIAHHFVTPDAEAARWLQLCFDVEDALLASGELQHDFAVAVCRRRS